jgi:HEAT repeat protein
MNDRLSEEYVNYYGDLIAAVAALQDVRSLDALVGAIATGNMAIGTLVGFGKQAVTPVARQLQHTDPHVRSAAARTLSQMVTAERLRIRFPNPRSR